MEPGLRSRRGRRARRAGPGFTLLPAPLRTGETLRFVIDGKVRSRPSRHAPAETEALAGHEFEASAWVFAEGACWIELEGGAFVEAARVDRLPAEIEGDLAPGAEGMLAGRVLPESYAPSDLAPIPDFLKAPGYEWRTMQLRLAALEAFREMLVASRRAGLEIGILSAFRTAEYQRGLYQRAVERDPSQNTTAAPGRSEHQLGTTVDVQALGIRPFTAALADSDAGRWLEANSARFGIVISYSRERHTARGAAFEPWHLRWVGDRVDEDREW